MNEQQQAQVKTLVGVVTSDKMEKTVVVEVTTFKVHRLYHKCFRWTKKYLSDTGSLEPQVGDTVRIVASRPISKLKRWTVAEVVTAAAATAKKEAAKAKPKAATTKKKAK